MNRNKKATANKQSSWLIFFTVAYAVGSLIGFISALKKDNLSEIFPPLGILSIEASVDLLLETVIYYGKFLLAAFICSMIPSGVIALPIIMSIQGYSFAIDSAALFSLYGNGCFVAVLLTYGIMAFVSIFCTMCISMLSATNRQNIRKVKLLFFIVFTVITAFFSVYDTYFSLRIIEYITK